MRKLMKSIFMGAAMLALPMMLTSCEGTLDDVFGEWDRPSKIPAEVFMFKKVLDEGATLTVSFKLNDSDASVTFKKEGDTYKVTSTLNPNNYAFTQINDDLVTLYITDGNDHTFGQIFFKISDGSYYIVNNIDANITFDGKVSVNGISGTVTNNCPDNVLINIDTDGVTSTYENSLIIYYNKANSETWKDVIKRYNNFIYFTLYPANSDKNVDARDVKAITDYMIGNGPEKFSTKAADMNNDTLFNIADIIQIVNQILSKE